MRVLTNRHTDIQKDGADSITSTADAGGNAPGVMPHMIYWTFCLLQDYSGSLEVCVYNDSSTDNTSTILQKWKDKLQAVNIPLVIGQAREEGSGPRGVGYAKNR